MGADSTGTAGANPFWTFSLALYAQPGVAPACLELQDRHGLDVNLLLYAAFAATRGSRLSVESLAAVEAAAGEWRDTMVRPLRELRRLAGDGFGEEGTRQALLAAELAAEQVQQRRMEAVLPLENCGYSAECLRENLEAVARLSGEAPALMDSFLALLEGVLPLPVQQ